MAAKYYDDAIAAKLKKWFPGTGQVRILKTDESKRLFELKAWDDDDHPIFLPMIALSRNNDIELLSNVKSFRTYNGLKLANSTNYTMQLNAIPIKLQYQVDIYAKASEDADDYVREYLFKLINNPTIKIVIPYNGINLSQVANIRVLSTVSDTSGIQEHLFSDQFTRWTIQLELQDAYLYNCPYRKNWKIYVDENDLVDTDEMSALELVPTLAEEPAEEDTEPLGIVMDRTKESI